MKKKKRDFDTFVKHLEDQGLRSKVEMRALKGYVSLRDLYEGSHYAPSIVAARREIYLWLRSSGKGVNEIARLFDRAPSGIARMISRRPE